MSSFYKTCFYNIALLVALAIPPLSGGCERQSEPPIQPKSATPAPAARPQVPASSGTTPAGPQSADTPASPASRKDDAAITAKVKTALMADDQVKGLAINVDTRNAEVTLKGALETDEQINRAVEVARDIEGVRNVVNRLSVKGEDKAATTNQG
jgi:hyperosmotically inducible periplasmic protein